MNNSPALVEEMACLRTGHYLDKWGLSSLTHIGVILQQLFGLTWRQFILMVSHYNDVIMGWMASQITNFTVDHSTVLFRSRSQKTSKPRLTGLCARNSPVTGEFPARKASNAEKSFHLMTSSCGGISLHLVGSPNRFSLYAISGKDPPSANQHTKTTSWHDSLSIWYPLTLTPMDKSFKKDPVHGLS